MIVIMFVSGIRKPDYIFSYTFTMTEYSEELEAWRGSQKDFLWLNKKVIFIEHPCFHQFEYHKTIKWIILILSRKTFYYYCSSDNTWRGTGMFRMFRVFRVFWYSRGNVSPINFPLLSSFGWMQSLLSDSGGMISRVLMSYEVH